MDFELFHRKEELAAHLLQQELWAQVGTQAPDSQCAFKRTFESQAKPMRNVQIFHILGCQVVVQITAGHAPFRRFVLQLDCPYEGPRSYVYMLYLFTSCG